MFVLRSLFWLATVVMLLPPSADGSHPAPRVSLLHTAYAARVLLQDVSGMCVRHPEACETSRQALVLLTKKMQTGAAIVQAGVNAGKLQAQRQAAPDADIDHGTLTMDDLAPMWEAATLASK